MTAEEACELQQGSMNCKGFIFKTRLAWTCGIINKLIENEAERGKVETYINRNKSFANKYYPILAKLYEKQGFFIAYENRNTQRNTFRIVWNFDALQDYKKEQYINPQPWEKHYDYHTKINEESINKKKKEKPKIKKTSVKENDIFDQLSNTLDLIEKITKQKG